MLIKELIEPRQTQSNKHVVNEALLLEFLPALLAGARLVGPLIPRIGPLLRGLIAGGAGEVAAGTAGRVAAGTAGQAAAGAAGQAAAGVARSAASQTARELAGKAASGIAGAAGAAGRVAVGAAGKAASGIAGAAVKNAPKLMTAGLLWDAYNSIKSSIGDAAKTVFNKLDDAADYLKSAIPNLDKSTMLELAEMAVKYSLPIGIVLAVLYGGKKLIDKLLECDQGPSPNPVL
jgi:hypothetical protein